MISSSAGAGAGHFIPWGLIVALLLILPIFLATPYPLPPGRAPQPMSYPTLHFRSWYTLKHDSVLGIRWYQVDQSVGELMVMLLVLLLMMIVMMMMILHAGGAAKREVGVVGCGRGVDQLVNLSVCDDDCVVSLHRCVIPVVCRRLGFHSLKT